MRIYRGIVLNKIGHDHCINVTFQDKNHGVVYGDVRKMMCVMNVIDQYEWMNGFLKNTVQKDTHVCHKYFHFLRILVR